MGLGAFVLLCSIVAIPLAVADAHAKTSLTSPSESCEVELFQFSFGVSRGSAIQDHLALHDSVSGEMEREEQALGIHTVSANGIAARSIAALGAETSQPDRIRSCIIIAGLAIPAILQVMILSLGSLPPPRVKEQEPSRYPAASVSVFTSIVRFGLLANYTVVLPYAASISESSGQGGGDSGYLIGVTSLGSLAGLFFFSFIPIGKLHLAYLGHGVIMLIGNMTWIVASHIQSFVLLTTARAFVGLEAGAGYNSAIAMAHHAKGAAITPCFVWNQASQDLGMLLGPALASVFTWLVKVFGYNTPVAELQETAGNVAMGLWAFLLIVALRITGPFPKPPDDANQVPDGHLVPEARQAAPEAVQDNSCDRGSALGLVLFIFQSAFLRHAQRLLLESGIIYVLAEHYKWAPETSGLAMVPIGLYCVLLELFFVTALEGRYSDRLLLFGLEFKQFAGCVMMLIGARTSSSVPIVFLAGGMCAYASTSVWGGVLQAYCSKRSIPNSIATRETILLANHLGAFFGCFLGAVSSRVALGESPSPSVLSLFLLGACCCQLMAAALTLEMQEDRMHLILGLGIASTMVACSLVPACGGSGFGSAAAWHIAFMGLAWAGAAPLCMWVWNTQHLPASWPGERQKTLLGGMCMGAIVLLSVAGLVATASSQKETALFGGIEISQGHLVMTRGWGRTVHALLGFGALLAVAVLIMGKVMKICWSNQTDFAKEIDDWDMGVGRCICSLALVVATIGVWLDHSTPPTAGIGWSPSLKVGLSTSIAFFICTIIFVKAKKEALEM